MAEQHTNEPDPPEQTIAQELDPASQSLAQALKVSFRLLGAIMVILIVVYVFTGIFTVKPDQQAVVLRFGKVVGARGEFRGNVLPPGPHFGWPYPIDEVITVPTGQRTLKIDGFWHYEAPGDKARMRREIRPAGKGLRPGYDGALMTGDQGLIHVKWQCKYQVPADDPQAVLDYAGNVADVEGLLTRVLENASIHVAAEYEVETIRRSDARFSRDVKMLAQGQLDRLRTGIRIRDLQYADQTPPLQTVKAFDEVTKAEQERRNKITEARQKATETLVAMAGENWQELADAILQYDRAVQAGVQADIDSRYADINALLMNKDRIKGQTRKIIHEAEAYRTAAVQRAKQAEDQFQKLLSAYEANPEVTISMLWNQTAQEILSRQEVLKIMVPGSRPFVLYPRQDPDVLQRLARRRAEETEKKMKNAPQR